MSRCLSAEKPPTNIGVWAAASGTKEPQGEEGAEGEGAQGEEEEVYRPGIKSKCCTCGSTVTQRHGAARILATRTLVDLNFLQD